MGVLALPSCDALARLGPPSKLCVRTSGNSSYDRHFGLRTAGSPPQRAGPSTNDAPFQLLALGPLLQGCPAITWHPDASNNDALTS